MLAVSSHVPIADAVRMVRARLSAHGEVVVTADHWHGQRLRWLRRLARELESGGGVHTAIEVVDPGRHGYLLCWPEGQPPIKWWRPEDGRVPQAPL
jgi:hypothetical protein